jgi:SAM-dependent methyltransferase
LLRRSQLGAFYRRRLLYPRLSRRIRGRLLDLGCGIGDMLAFRPGSVGVDVNERTVDHCRRQGLTAFRMEVDHLPFADRSFDTVLMDNVLEHILDPRPLLAEVRRVLLRGGRLIVGVPGRRGWDSDPDHKVFYDDDALRQLLEANGFACQEIFHAPLFGSAWLGRKLRQYCVYGVFVTPP